MDAFYTWNPSVHYNCTGLQLDMAYCVLGDGYDDTSFENIETSSTASIPSSTSTSTPSPSRTCFRAVTPPGPTQTDIPCKCNKYAKHEDGKYCQDMANDDSITLDDFYKWNPAVGASCGSLLPDYYYCVGMSS